MAIIESPCLGCKDKTVEPNCHITCTKYIEFAESRRNQTEAIRQYKLNNRKHLLPYKKYQ